MNREGRDGLRQLRKGGMMPKVWEFDHHPEFSRLYFGALRVVVSDTGFISIDQPESGMGYIDLEHRSIRNQIHLIERIEGSGEYVRVYFENTPPDTFLQLTATTEGLIADWWDDGELSDTAATEGVGQG